MELTGPKNVRESVADSETTIIKRKIEEKFNNNKTTVTENTAVLMISGEYSARACEIVIGDYMNKAGWRAVNYRTSSENGERPGITRFTFYF